MRLAALWSGPLSARTPRRRRAAYRGRPRGLVGERAGARRARARARGRAALARGGHRAPGAPRSSRCGSTRCARCGASAIARASGAARRGWRPRSRRSGLTDAADARAVREARPRWSAETAGTITDAEFEPIVRHPDARHPATLLLAAMVEVLPRLYWLASTTGGSTSRTGWGRARRIRRARSVSRVAALLGRRGSFDVFQARAIATQVEVEAGPPPALLLPPTFVALPRQEAYLQLGRQLGHLRAGTYAVVRVPCKDLGLLIAAGVRTVFPDYGRGMLPEERLNDVSQKIARALPRRHRRAFEQAALSFRDAGVFDSERWRAASAAPGPARRSSPRATCSARSSTSRASIGARRGGRAAARGALARRARERRGRRDDQLRRRRRALDAQPSPRPRLIWSSRVAPRSARADAQADGAEAGFAAAAAASAAASVTARPTRLRKQARPSATWKESRAACPTRLAASTAACWARRLPGRSARRSRSSSPASCRAPARRSAARR